MKMTEEQRQFFLSISERWNGKDKLPPEAQIWFDMGFMIGLVHSLDRNENL